MINSEMNKTIAKRELDSFDSWADFESSHLTVALDKKWARKMQFQAQLPKFLSQCQKEIREAENHYEKAIQELKKASSVQARGCQISKSHEKAQKKLKTVIQELNQIGKRFTSLPAVKKNSTCNTR